MSLKHVLLTLTVVVVLCHLTYGCSPLGNERSYSLEETLGRAQVVVSGTDVAHATEFGDGLAGANYTFEVSCVFKSGGLEIPPTIFVINVGLSSCVGTYMEPAGKSYVIGLKEAEDDEVAWGNYHLKDSDKPYYFVADEPSPTSTAAFDATTQNLELAASLCGMDDDIVRPTDSNRGNSCPSRTVTMETCVDTSGAGKPQNFMYQARQLSTFGALVFGLIVSLVSLFLVI